MIAGILLAACMVPERLRLTGIIADPSYGAAIAQRLKHEPFEKVAKTLPADDPKVGFATLGWITREQLKGTDKAPAAALHVGGTAAIDSGAFREFVHLQEVRPAMTCDRAIVRYPDDEWALNARASTEMQAGNRRGALADYSTVIRLNPTSYDARYGRAVAYYVDGNFDAALVDAGEAVSANGGKGDGHMLLGLIEEARGDDDLATADEADALAQYHGRMQDDTPARYALGVAYKNLGYFAAAIDEFDATLQKLPTDTNALLSRGFAWFASGDLVKAKTDFLAAAQAQPSQGRAHLALALLSFATGDTAAARAYAQQASRLDRHDAYAALWVLVSERALNHAFRLAPGETVDAFTRWPAPAITVFLDRAPVASLEASSSSSDPFTRSIRLCEARFYGALYALAGGDDVRGVPLLRLAAGECPYREQERAVAQQMLRARDPAMNLR
jgi:tetratricopeptide (TPR) repeat protein